MGVMPRSSHLGVTVITYFQLVNSTSAIIMTGKLGSSIYKTFCLKIQKCLKTKHAADARRSR